MSRTDPATDDFIRTANIVLFRKRLTETTEPAERVQLLKLLQEEEAKG